MPLSYYQDILSAPNAVTFALKLILIIATLWMTISLFRSTLIVPKSMDLKIKALILTSLIPQCLNLVINFTPASLQISGLSNFLDFCSLNAFSYMQFDVLQIFRFLLYLLSVLCDWWKPVYMPRIRIIVMCSHFVATSFYYYEIILRIAGNTSEFSADVDTVAMLGQIIGPSIYVIYSAIQSAAICHWINIHMKRMTALADNRGQNFQSDDWMPRFRRLYWIQIVLFFSDVTAITAGVLANVINQDPWWALDDISVSGIFVECLAVGFIFIELRGICLTLNASNEQQNQKHVKMKRLGRGIRVAEVATVKLVCSSGTPATPNAGNNKANPINTATQLIESRYIRV